jgi:hypothetical protein
VGREPPRRTSLTTNSKTGVTEQQGARLVLQSTAFGERRFLSSSLACSVELTESLSRQLRASCAYRPDSYSSVRRPAIKTNNDNISQPRRLHGKQVTGSAVRLEGVEVKCEKGVNMGPQLHIEEESGYLAARFIGTGKAMEAWRRFELIAVFCKWASQTKLLLDFAEAYAELSLADRYSFGEESLIFAHYNLKKVAFLVRPEHLDPQSYVKAFRAGIGL